MGYSIIIVGTTGYPNGEKNWCINHTLSWYSFQKNQLCKCKDEDMKVLTETVEGFLYNFRTEKTFQLWF